jgi:hypothetical protein
VTISSGPGEADAFAAVSPSFSTGLPLKAYLAGRIFPPRGALKEAKSAAGEAKPAAGDLKPAAE